MRNIFVLSVFSLFLVTVNPSPTEAQRSDNAQWKAGVARVVITPGSPMWMAGYGSRTHPSEGILHDLWAKALAFEDARGNRAVLVTTDLLGIPKNLSDRIRDRIEKSYKLKRSQITLNSSHTHSGPVLENSLLDIYPLDADESKKVKQYSDKLVDQIVSLVGKALESMVPVQVFAENGVTRFQVNRRNNSEATLARQTELNGPADYAVPVMKVVNNAGELIAVAFGYACHNTVLSGYDWSGDYAGFAQLALEASHPGITALYFQGAGADQNPLPRRTVALARQYGEELAAAVERVLKEDMRKLAPELATAYAEVDLRLNQPPSKDAFEKMAKAGSGYQQRWATRMLGKIERGESFRTSYPYPLQVWKLGDQPIMSLGGELVVAYANELKRMFGSDIFVLGYSNDVMAYIPSTTILREGGYEGASSQIVYGLPATWAPGIQTVILEGLVKLAEQAGVSMTETKLYEN